ncbi:hypothetical protein M513_13145 [Trichuris suis]|uniref:Uncharacterized protein n=1 Tax=Trichuris suis TaxID=68888 RepID=A0A085LLZ3_9BILA|nr:hypothetical protein M513_13143 [Trichuris suis]KFD45989.1 hypothetical protein M513_13145 [Trichuris suis]
MTVRPLRWVLEYRQMGWEGRHPVESHQPQGRVVLLLFSYFADDQWIDVHVSLPLRVPPRTTVEILLAV